MFVRMGVPNVLMFADILEMSSHREGFGLMAFEGRGELKG